MSWILLILVEAQAAGLDTISDEGVTVVVRGVGESWADPHLGSAYRPSAFMGGVGLVIPVHPMLVLDLEAAAGRWVGSALECDVCVDTRLSVRPLSLVIEGRVPLDHGYAFAGVGPSLAVFSEESELTVAGEKGSLDLRIGLRWDMGMDLERTRGTSLELYGGRRMQRNAPDEADGFDLAAWRGSVGIGFTF